MKGPHAICPSSGADLSEDRHPDDRGIPQREPQTPDHDVLSTGQTHSSRRALTAFFERTHGEYADDPERTQLPSATRYLRALKSETDARDEWVWYALAERLHRDGFNVGWMRMADVVLVCPHCGSWLKYRPAPKGELLPKCGVNCRDRDEFVFGDIRREIRETFTAAFDSSLDRGQLQITER
ncbi:hypothetical protein [Halorussus salinus]|uniref:hypothetical protein n=1 Tax=Halorussus salinus TaxID=1364935 RepID=UPI0010925F93|nr:hypothetical protein [Halorussus salinus]